MRVRLDLNVCLADKRVTATFILAENAQRELTRCNTVASFVKVPKENGRLHVTITRLSPNDRSTTMIKSFLQSGEFNVLSADFAIVGRPARTTSLRLS